MLENTPARLAARAPPLRYGPCLAATKGHPGTATGVSVLTVIGQIKKKPTIQHGRDRVPLSNHAELLRTLPFQRAGRIRAALLPAVCSHLPFPMHGNKPMSFRDNEQAAATGDSQMQRANVLGDAQSLLRLSASTKDPQAPPAWPHQPSLPFPKPWAAHPGFPPPPAGSCACSGGVSCFQSLHLPSLHPYGQLQSQILDG